MGDGGMVYQMRNFDPMVDNGRTFRQALGQFATGVTVVTTNTADGPLGMTANSFSSVSMEPPLVLWSPSKYSRRYPHFDQSDYFAIHVLSAEQNEICGGFAKSSNAFEGLEWGYGAENVPLIDNCLARFECKKHACHDGGDHIIMVGEVLRASMSEGAPLLFFGGGFGSFDASKKP